MGERLHLDYQDSLFRKTRLEIKGISGGCFCCGMPLHVNFNDLEILPVAKINDNLFQVLVCDSCEQDIAYLEQQGIPNVSFDILCNLQEDLKEKLLRFEEYYGSYTNQDRYALLEDLYLRTYEVFKNYEEERKKDNEDIKKNNKKKNS